MVLSILLGSCDFQKKKVNIYKFGNQNGPCVIISKKICQTTVIIIIIIIFGERGGREE